jgi:oligopeptide/dipeptide ABC transporter ATP-binding protein
MMAETFLEKPAAAVADTLLDVRDLSIHFLSGGRVNKAVDGVSFTLRKGETLGIVGESGSGKSALSRAIMRLLPSPPTRYAGGEILFDGQDLLAVPENEIRKIRGKKISMIFQEPMVSLNPLMTIGYQISEALILHEGLSSREARERAIEMLTQVRIADAERRFDQYPHEMSGGMRQRCMIAIALACQPELLIADEPTTALDVTIQAQVLRLIVDLKTRLGMGVILVTHNFGVINQVADRVVVMYAGSIVETASKSTILRSPRHPYTEALLGSVPRLDSDAKRLNTIAGTMPSGANLPYGCRFHPRCPKRMPVCSVQEPPALALDDGHIVKCWLADPKTVATEAAHV